VTLVDTNVVLDVITDDLAWRPWSVAMLDRQSDIGPIVISDVVYAELSPAFATEQTLDDAISRLGMVLHRIPKPALFVAGQAFKQYRRGPGARTTVLADFFIGAHAEVTGLPILTRDTRRYRTYFPDVELIAPER
jgi:predicted nucleic acid-binding protein